MIAIRKCRYCGESFDAQEGDQNVCCEACRQTERREECRTSTVERTQQADTSRDHKITAKAKELQLPPRGKAIISGFESLPRAKGADRRSLEEFIADHLGIPAADKMQGSSRKQFSQQTTEKGR